MCLKINIINVFIKFSVLELEWAVRKCYLSEVEHIVRNNKSNEPLFIFLYSFDIIRIRMLYGLVILHLECIIKATTNQLKPNLLKSLYLSNKRIIFKAQ